MEDFARFSIRETALSARGAIHSAVQIFAGSGVLAQADMSIEIGRTIESRRVLCMLRSLQSGSLQSKPSLGDKKISHAANICIAKF